MNPTSMFLAIGGALGLLYVLGAKKDPMAPDGPPSRQDKPIAQRPPVVSVPVPPRPATPAPTQPRPRLCEGAVVLSESAKGRVIASMWNPTDNDYGVMLQIVDDYTGSGGEGAIRGPMTESALLSSVRVLDTGCGSGAVLL